MSRTLLITLLFFLNASVISYAQPTTDLTAQVDALFADWTRPGHPGGAVGIVKDGQLVLARAYGLASLEYEAPNTPETVFNIGSVSKQFTAYAILLLAQEGKLSIDDDIRKYLPEVPDFGVPITIRHLMHHTSGLRNFQNLLGMAGWREGDAMTNADLLKYISFQKELNYHPGSEYLYCNTGFNFMAEIVERVSGQTFNDWTRDHIFQPLGMPNSGFREDLEAVHPNTATSYDRTTDGTFRRPKEYWTYQGNGNLYTTVGDLAKWIDNFHSHRVGGAEGIAALTTRGVLNNGDTISYARGIVVDQYRGLRRWQHGGSVGGYRAQLLYFPDQRTGIVVLTNFSSANPGGKANEVADLYLGQAFPEPKREANNRPAVPRVEVNVAPELFDAYAGAYLVLGSGGIRVTLSRNGDGLYAQQNGMPASRLYAASDSSFFMKEANIALIAHRNGAGKTERLTLFTPDRSVAQRLDPALLSPESLAQYAGDYYGPELKTTYAVVVENGKLIVRHARHNDFELTPISPDRLDGANWLFGEVRVERNRGGGVRGLRVSNGRVRNLWLEKQ